MALLVRVLIGPFGDLFAQWQQVVWVLSIASMILGSLAAITQTNIKRLMAYSSIGHVGFILVGLAAGNRSDEHTSELQSLMRISYAVFCLKKKISHSYTTDSNHNNTQTT